MTPKTLSVTLGRPLGAGLLFGGLLLAGLAAVAASWADLSAAIDERDAKAELLERGVLASRRAQAMPRLATADPFVPGDTATLAAAAVDSDLRAVAASAGMTLLSSRAEAKPDEPGVSGTSSIGTRVEDQAVVEGQNEALQAMLVALDGGTPAVMVDDVAVEPATVDGGGGSDLRAPRLHVSLTISAFWRPGRTAGR